MKSSRPVRVLLLAVALLWLPAAAPAQKHKDVEKIGQRDINKGSWNLYSLEREIELGRRVSARVEAQARLAHERAHVTARHATKQYTKATLFQWMTLPLVFVGGPVGYGVQQALSVAGPPTFLEVKRNARRGAGFPGVQYPSPAGYDPVALVDFLERLKEKDKEGRLAMIFSSHPMTKDRIKR